MNAHEVIAKAGRVAVLMGGPSAEREVSLKSGAAVLAGLLEAGVDAFALELPAQPQKMLPALQAAQFDTAFIVVHGRGGEDGKLQAVLEALGKGYTGSDVAASALAMDKWRTKLVWNAVGIPTKPAQLVNAQTDALALVESLGLPLAIKPVHEGSSVGLRKVSTIESLQEALELALEYDDMVMAEPWVTGKELTVGILNDQVLPTISLTTPHEFYDYDAKYLADDTCYNFDTGLDIAEQAQLAATCRQAFDVIGCKGWGRIDIMVDSEGLPWLLEVNTVPGMTDHSLIPMAARKAGLEMPALVVEILSTAIAAHGVEGGPLS
ncbi:D-alanine--D-alanine ligase [Pokkaliibacter sp. CJK22405]|uniref:D-alanine--D-alanine ligase n=1 Tax=Pokkaliibacter sp. CJK22405 TaxID=3384615 RepID=UPI0039852C0B